MKEEAEHLDSMVRNLLSMTRLEAGGLELRRDWTDLSEIAGQARRRGARQVITVTAAPSLPFVRADLSLIEQALTNVVGNSVKFAGGDAHITVALHTEAGAAVVTVTDDGPGIAADHLVLLCPPARAPIEPGMEARAGDIQRFAQPRHRPDAPVLRDEGEPHVASLAKKAAAFFRMSRSAFSFATSRGSRSISSCSGFTWPWPGNACDGSADNSRIHLRRTFSRTSRSRPACATETPRSLINRTASTLNSRENFRRCISILQFLGQPYLGVHGTGSRPILQVDGYAGYRVLAERTSVRLACCWSHVRRRFYEFAAAGPAPIATEALARIAELYRIEGEIRGRSAVERRAVRQARSFPIVKALDPWLRDKLALVSQKSKLAEAIRYALSRWAGLCRFLDDGRVEIDTNVVERSIRPIALNRKNALFAGSDGGAEHWAVIALLVETAKLNAVEPQSYLADVIARIVEGHAQSQIDDLLPWAYAPAPLKAVA